MLAFAPRMLSARRLPSGEMTAAPYGRGGRESFSTLPSRSHAQCGALRALAATRSEAALPLLLARVERGATSHRARHVAVEALGSYGRFETKRRREQVVENPGTTPTRGTMFKDPRLGGQIHRRSPA